ncbi:MAG: transcriptional repressor NrdR [Candidatus Kerfeldbacteria bacterium]|nr:transcriptional repressor NrdR [Candidatus Kerfeldbacteria bacterium]
MRCPACHNIDTKVTDTRMVNEAVAIRRRRECLRCGFRFSTYEEVEILNLTVVKRDGRQEPYSREKLETGLRKAFEKRPITHESFKRLLNIIERDIQLRGRNEITSHQIGEIVMKRLKKVDPVAYIRFASVYRSFTDAESFWNELQLFQRGRQRPKNPRRTKNN